MKDLPFGHKRGYRKEGASGRMVGTHTHPHLALKKETRVGENDVISEDYRKANCLEM